MIWGKKARFRPRVHAKCKNCGNTHILWLHTARVEWDYEKQDHVFHSLTGSVQEPWFCLPCVEKTIENRIHYVPNIEWVSKEDTCETDQD